MSSTRAPSSMASAGSCVMMMAPRPSASLAFRRDTRSIRVSRSTLPKGSSSSSSLASAASARASETRCASPPDKVPTSRPSIASRPMSRRAARARSWRLALSPVRTAKATLLTASRCGNKVASWKASASARFSGATRMRPGRETSTACNRMLPAVGGSKPAIMRISEVLPLPEGPRMASTSPGAMSKETSDTTGRTPMTRVRDCTESMSHALR